MKTLISFFVLAALVGGALIGCNKAEDPAAAGEKTTTETKAPEEGTEPAKAPEAK